MKVKPAGLLASCMLLTIMGVMLCWPDLKQKWRVRNRTHEQQAAVEFVHGFKTYLADQDYSNAYRRTSSEYKRKYAIEHFWHSNPFASIPYDPTGVYPSIVIEIEGEEAKVWVSRDRGFAIHLLKEEDEWKLTYGFTVVLR